jgi:predicted RNA binding protein YcfA (HicA-like mRNA interferase family)
MKIPRDLSATELIALLKPYKYEVTRQNGSHIRLTTQLNGTHHITIPNHNPIRIGTLAGILSEIAMHLQITKDELIKDLFN